MTPLEETQVRIRTLLDLVELRNRSLHETWRLMIEDELRELRVRELQLRRGPAASQSSGV